MAPECYLPPLKKVNKVQKSQEKSGNSTEESSKNQVRINKNQVKTPESTEKSSKKFSFFAY